MAKNLKVTQVKSQISERPNMRETLRSLGLKKIGDSVVRPDTCLLYTSPSPRDGLLSRMPSSA